MKRTNYRSRLAERGIARFDVLGLETHRDMIRALARHLAQARPVRSEEAVWAGRYNEPHLEMTLGQAIS